MGKLQKTGRYWCAKTIEVFTFESDFNFYAIKIAISLKNTPSIINILAFMSDFIKNKSVSIENQNGASLTVLSYGAIIQSLKIPVGNEIRDVVLGFETVEDYITSYNLPSAPYFGTIVGRFAGRINQGKFILDGNEIQLHCNHGTNHLHGGENSLSKKFWKIEQTTDAPNPSVTLSCESEALEENYPGTLSTKVTYTLTESNELKVSISATTDERTIVNLTNHSYFNLDGNAKNVCKHDLRLNAQKALSTNEQQIPTGEMIDLVENPFDFMKNENVPLSIDTTFVNHPELSFGTLTSRDGKLSLEIQTNQPSIHIYVGGNCFGQISGKQNQTQHPQSGICFEAQNFPDAPNHPNFPTCDLLPNQTYLNETVFSFKTHL